LPKKTRVTVQVSQPRLFLNLGPRAFGARALGLRLLIDEMKEAITANRRNLEIQFKRIDHLQAQIHRLVEAWQSSEKD
jgi:hypothetical protein